MITIENAFDWLKSPDAEIDATRLVSPATNIVAKIIDSIQSGNYIQTYQMVDYLEANTSELESMVDIGDIWVEIGLAFYQMGNLNKAEEFWTRAVRDYPVISHEHAVVLWLLGSVQWLIETKNINAMNNWRVAIREFGDLADRAQINRRINVKIWYGDRITELEESLEEQINIKFP